jgi:SAM-dependent methyltransferase
LDRRSALLAPRPRVRIARSPLGPDEIERIRRERLAPNRNQWDYLHLEGLRRGLVSTIDRLEREGARGPVLDLFCGAKPYAPLVPWKPVIGLDIDRYFGGADVIGDLPLPFRDASFGVAFCTQALHMVDDPVGTVEELGRVVADHGHVVVTIPHLFLAEGDFERHLAKKDLVDLFSDWEGVAVRGVDGPGAALTFVLGRLAMLSARHWRVAGVLYTPAVRSLTAMGAVVDALAGPLRRRWPHSLVLVARRPPRAA